MKIGSVVGFALGMVAGSMVTRLRDEMELKRQSAPKKNWSEKTLEEKEAALKRYDRSDNEIVKKCNELLRQDLERQKANRIYH